MTLPNESNVITSRWTTEGVSARCYACDWRKRGSQSSVVAAAKRHVEGAPAHKVELTRSQWRLTMTDPNERQRATAGE